jgi:hypothetical protein
MLFGKTNDWIVFPAFRSVINHNPAIAMNLIS